jgi:hypothetical protein
MVQSRKSDLVKVLPADNVPDVPAGNDPVGRLAQKTDQLRETNVVSAAKQPVQYNPNSSHRSNKIAFSAWRKRQYSIKYRWPGDERRLPRGVQAVPPRKKISACFQNGPHAVKFTLNNLLPIRKTLKKSTPGT